MSVDLFAGIPVIDFERARLWYERLLGAEPSFFPHETEAVWALGEHRLLYIVEQPARAGHAVVLLWVEELDARVAAIASRGIEPADRETVPGKARKVIYRDVDGNEVAFGGSWAGLREWPERGALVRTELCERRTPGAGVWPLSVLCLIRQHQAYFDPDPTPPCRRRTLKMQGFCVPAVVPTRVGVNRSIHPSGRWPTGGPHARGGEPTPAAKKSASKTRSPRAWG